jgi:hypothetical protein
MNPASVGRRKSYHHKVLEKLCDLLLQKAKFFLGIYSLTHNCLQNFTFDPALGFLYLSVVETPATETASVFCKASKSIGLKSLII